MTVIEKLAEWTSNASTLHPTLAIERASEAFEDVIGCMIAGLDEPSVTRVRRSVARRGEGGAMVIGQRSGAPAPLAALINGTSAHALDYDDEFLPALTHASAVMVPALLAIAEERNLPGAAIMDAYIVGIELHAALGRGVIRSHYDMGWHATSTIGAIGTAGACARLLGLDVSGVAHALSIGVSMASGCKVQFGSMAKSLHAGLAAQRAIEAAELAAAGVEGQLNALEGPMGFLDLCGGPSPAGWNDSLGSLGEPLAIIKYGLMAKRYPCCTAAHRILDCVRKLRYEERFEAKDVVSVDALVGYGHKKNLMYEDPQTETEARFSMQYCVAVALLFGDVKLADFTPQAVHRPDVRALHGLIRVNASKPGAEQMDSAAVAPHEVTIMLRDGRKLKASQLALKGSIEAPFDKAERDAKFKECTLNFMTDSAACQLRHHVWSLASSDNVGNLAQMLRNEVAIKLS